jgi:hypothetical protein
MTLRAVDRQSIRYDVRLILIRRLRLAGPQAIALHRKISATFEKAQPSHLGEFESSVRVKGGGERYGTHGCDATYRSSKLHRSGGFEG